MHRDDRIILLARATHVAASLFVDQTDFRLVKESAPVIAHPATDHLVDDRVDFDRRDLARAEVESVEHLSAAAAADDEDSRILFAEVSDAGAVFLVVLMAAEVIAHAGTQVLHPCARSTRVEDETTRAGRIGLRIRWGFIQINPRESVPGRVNGRARRGLLIRGHRDWQSTVGKRRERESDDTELMAKARQ